MKKLTKSLILFFICFSFSISYGDPKFHSKFYSSIDKTNFIKNIIEHKSKIFLITRPHSWGKSTNLSKLENFFMPLLDKFGDDVPRFKKIRYNEIVREHIVHDQRIMEEYFFQYPVININFSFTPIESKEQFRQEITKHIKNSFYLYTYLNDSKKITEEERSRIWKYDYRNNNKLSDEEIIDSLRFLTQLLKKHFGKNCLILINKYDNHARYWHLNNKNPSQKDKELLNYIHKLTGKMINKSLLNNDSLYKAVIIGVTDIADMKIFDKIPSVRKDSLLNPTFADDFGFNKQELLDLFKKYNLKVTEEDMVSIKKHYGGYFLDGQDIYNPAAIQTMSSYFQRDGRPAYDFDRLIKIQSDFDSTKKKQDLRKLLDGKSLDIIINPNAGYEALYSKNDDFYSLLVFEGFLTFKNLKKLENGKYKAQAYIPNIEMRNAFRDIYESMNPDKKEIRVYKARMGNI